ncbi:MAG: hypothetical protein ACPHER_11160, partial [Nevskiales bacterium]
AMDNRLDLPVCMTLTPWFSMTERPLRYYRDEKFLRVRREDLQALAWRYSRWKSLGQKYGCGILRAAQRMNSAFGILQGRFSAPLFIFYWF